LTTTIAPVPERQKAPTVSSMRLIIALGASKKGNRTVVHPQ